MTATAITQIYSLTISYIMIAPIIIALWAISPGIERIMRKNAIRRMFKNDPSFVIGLLTAAIHNTD